MPPKVSDYMVPPDVVGYLTAGHRVQASDSFWLRAVQDLDYCDQPVSKQLCQGKSWLFQIIDLSTSLDKNFLEAYVYGGLSLTVVVNDFQGASHIFDKGVAQFPNDLNLIYAAAYHASIEEKDYLKASKLYYQAGELGGPPWVKVLAGRLANQGGDTELANLILQKMIEETEDPKLIERLAEKIKENNRTK